MPSSTVKMMVKTRFMLSRMSPMLVWEPSGLTRRLLYCASTMVHRKLCRHRNGRAEMDEGIKWMSRRIGHYKSFGTSHQIQLGIASVVNAELTPTMMTATMAWVESCS